MQILFFILILLTASIHALGQSKGKVFDLTSGNPVIGVVLINEEGEIATITDRGGLFVLPHAEGVFEVSALGYRDTSIIFRNVNKKKFREIGLTPKTYNLPEIYVTDNQLEPKIFELRKRRLKSFPVEKISVLANGYINWGTSFQNQHSGNITSVSIYFSEPGHIDDNQFIRLRILEMNSEGMPESDLLTKTVLLKPKEEGWHTVDLKEYNVPLNGNDFLVAAELIFRSYDERSLEENRDTSRSRNLPQIAYTRIRSREKSDYSVWYNTNQSPWRNLTERFNFFPHAPFFRIEALIDP